MPAYQNNVEAENNVLILDGQFCPWHCQNSVEKICISYALSLYKPQCHHNFVLSPQNIKYESNRVKIKSLLIWGLKWWHLFLLRVIATFGFFLGLFINCRFFETNFLLIAVIVWGRRASLFSFCGSSFQNWSRNDWQKRADRIDFLTAKLQSSQNLKSV